LAREDPELFPEEEPLREDEDPRDEPPPERCVALPPPLEPRRVFGAYARLSDFDRLVGRDESTAPPRGFPTRRPISPALRSMDRVSTERAPFVAERTALGERVITRCSRCCDTVFDRISLEPCVTPSRPAFDPVGRLRITLACFSPCEYFDATLRDWSNADALLTPNRSVPLGDTPAN
jgi:hypothetical protein